MGVNSLHWYYTPSPLKEGEEITLEGDEWHHCFNVLRMRSGDNIILCDGKGACMEGNIRSASSKEGRVDLTRDLTLIYQNPRPYKVSIGIAPTRNIDRTEFAVEKLVELGIDEICFLDCRHGERPHLRMDRIQKIMIAAAKQSRKITFPLLHDMVAPDKYMDRKKDDLPNALIMACHLDLSNKSISENYLPGMDVVLLVGPEGGFSVEELEMMGRKGAKLVHLGPFRLRVETAAITACAGIHLINEMKSR